MPFTIAKLTAALVLALLVPPVLPSAAQAAEVPWNWRSDWALAEGFRMEPAAEGFALPSALAFVPEPGPAADDPLYFVTELRGTVKVVTNSGAVHVFARDFFTLEPPEELPAQEGELGLAGICLAPEHGYVYVTFVYQDSEGVLRNNLMRFTAAGEAEPGRFALAPTEAVDYAALFAAEVAAPSHQIGPCQVVGEHLFVSVGDGEQPPESRRESSLLGKVLRLTLDAEPAPGNPFVGAGPAAAEALWAKGLRNPFGLEALDGRLFVADNGPDVDRFLEIEAGGDYLWDGSNWSITSAAAFVFTPSQSPVQLDYLGAGAEFFPASHRERFYVALAGDPRARGGRVRKVEGVVSLDFDLAAGRMRRPPEYLVQYRGEAPQMVTGLAVGPDGLYFSPILPDRAGRSPVYRVFWEPVRAHPYVIGRESDPRSLMRPKGCYACHRLEGVGGSVGPVLDREELVPRLARRLASPEYTAQLDRVDAISAEPFARYRGARQEVRAAEGDERLRTWLRYHLMEPKFDNPNAQMPNLAVSEDEARRLADFLLGLEAEQEEPTLRQRVTAAVESVVPFPRYRHIPIAFVAGLATAVLATWAIIPRLRRRKGARR